MYLLNKFNTIKRYNMGNKWGVIHNQYDEEIIYTLHSTQMCPLEQTIKKTANIAANFKPIEGTVDVGNYLHNEEAGVGYESEVKKEALKNDGVYTLPAGRIGTAGLSKIDFDVVKFLTIVTVSGEYIIKSGKVGCQQDLRIVIRDKDHSIRNLNKNQSQLLKQFAMGGTIQNGICGKCQKKQLADLKGIQDDRRCTICSKKTKQLWICRERPGVHFFCFDCNKSLQYGKQMKEQKITV